MNEKIQVRLGVLFPKIKCVSHTGLEHTWGGVKVAVTSRKVGTTLAFHHNWESYSPLCVIQC